VHCIDYGMMIYASFPNYYYKFTVFGFVEIGIST
jgi:hypothetical protein